VIVLDRASFPSDTMSTHLFFPSHWLEIEKLGALARVRELGGPEHTEAALWAEDIPIRGRYNPIEGIARGSSLRRPGLDMALVETTREAGAEVRERVRLTELVRRADGRVTGVQYRAHDGEEGEIRARLVIGADGRASRTAKLVGAQTHHEAPNRRLLAYAYYRDTSTPERHVAAQWRVGNELGTVFPCDGGLSVVLIMSPVERAIDYRDNAETAFDATVAAIPGMAKRLAGCDRESPVKISVKHPAYFRHSHGPGWALAGDAGHFKDPIIAQGIRDALRFGRLLGEAVSCALDDEVELQRALASWEHRRDSECLDAYQWGNRLGQPDHISPLEFASHRWFAGQEGRGSQLLDIFSRVRKPQDVFTSTRALWWAFDAARDPHVPLRDLTGVLGRDIRREFNRRLERRAFTKVRDSAPRITSTTVGDGQACAK
jgi:flavin-dependent dehydrogenase